MPKPLNSLSSASGPPLPGDRLSEGQQEKQARFAAVTVQNGRAVSLSAARPGAAPATAPAAPVAPSAAPASPPAFIPVADGTYGAVTFGGGAITDATNAAVGATATVGDATHVAAVTTDSLGRLAGVAAVAIAFPTVPNFATGETPGGAVNGANAAFTLAHAAAAGSVAVYAGSAAGSLYRVSPSLFTVSGATVTFATPPASGATLLADYRY